MSGCRSYTQALRGCTQCTHNSPVSHTHTHTNALVFISDIVIYWTTERIFQRQASSGAFEKLQKARACVCVRVYANVATHVGAKARACAQARVAVLIQQATYCLHPLWLHHIFRHYLINGTIFGKNVIEYKMCVLIFSTTFIWNISHSKKNSLRYYHKCVNVFM
jgi:hypothetical protein